MNRQGVDLIIIGAGPGGYVGAIAAAQRGLRVALVEGREVGGVCLHAGCIPTKAMIAGLDVLRQARAFQHKGVVSGKLEATWASLREHRQRVVNQLTQGLKYLLNKNGVQVVPGWARFEDSQTVRILDVARSQETAILQSPAVIVATGSRPAGLPGIERNGTTVLDSADALNLEDAPKELLILGGGYVGCEFACVFSALGSRVTLLEAQSRLLPGMDRELGQALERALRRAGLTLLLNTQARSVESGNSVRVLLTDGQVLAGDKLLVSIGRIPCSDGLGLEAAGVQLDGRAIRVNDFLETNVPGIYAVGDVTGKCPLAHVASAQARFVVDRILARNQRPDSPPSAESEDDKRFVTHGGHEPGPLEGRAPARPAPGQSLPQASQGLRPPEIGRQSMESEGKPDRPFSYRAIPACVFTYPEIASVGLTEADAAAAGMTVRVSRFPFAASGKALAAGDSEGFVKLVADAKTGQLLGGQIMGTHASELIGQVTLAVQNQLTAAAMVDTIAAHPTLSEAIHETAEGLFGQSIHIFSRPATPLG